MKIIKHESGKGKLHEIAYRTESGDECHVVVAEEGVFDFGLSERTRYVLIVSGGCYLKMPNQNEWYGNRSIGPLCEINTFAIKPGQPFQINVCLDCTICFHVSNVPLSFGKREING